MEFYINGVCMQYVDMGAGAPVLMLHGNPTWSIYYRNVVAALKSDYRCIVPDHIGMGYSDKPRNYPYTLRQRVDDLEALLDHLEVTQNITLIAHDWGGMIGMAYATRHPERISRFVLMNTAGFHLPPLKAMPFLLSLVRDSWLGWWGVMRWNAFARGAAWVGCTRQRMPQALREAYCAPFRDNPIATLRFVQDIPLRPTDPAYDIVSDVQANLEQFRDRPAMLCWGMRDFVFDAHFLQEWKRYWPHAAIHEFADCGHFVLEDASDEIIPLIKEFLQGS